MYHLSTSRMSEVQNMKNNHNKINRDTLYGPAQTWSSNTLHIFWWSGSGKGGETMKTNKSWTCFSHAYDFHYAYRYGPFFCLNFLIIDLCLQLKEGTKVGGFPFLCSSLPTDFLQSHQSVGTNREPCNNRYLVCIAEVAAWLCTTCSLFHEGSLYVFPPIIASQQDGMKRVHSTSNNSIIIYYRVNGHEDYI